MTEPGKHIDQALSEYFRGESEAVKDGGFSESIDRMLAARRRLRRLSFVLAGLLASMVAIAIAPGVAGFGALPEQFVRWFGDGQMTLAGLLAILSFALAGKASLAS